jgi:DNA topoisomerase-2
MYVGAVAPQVKTCWVLDESKNLPELKWEEVSYSPALVKLFDEVVSNAIDESYRLGHKSAKGGTFTIWVNTEKDFGNYRFTVRDNGRGIPLRKAKDSEHLMADLALQHLRAGSNFDADRAVSIGTHGLGVTLVNILSEDFQAEIEDGELFYSLKSCRGIQRKRALSPKKGDPYTKISYMPDRSIFDLDSVETAVRIIRRRIFDLAACFPAITFKLDGLVVQSRTFKRYAGAISSSPLCGIGPDPLVFEYENLRLAILSSDDNINLSFVNGIDTYEGGTHLEYVRNKIIDVVAAKLSKKHKVDIKPNDIRAKTCFVVMLDGVVDPQFRSQTKEYLSSPPGSWTHLIKDFDGEAVAKKMIGSSHICDQIVEAFILKKEAKERAEVKRLGKDMKKLRVAKHLPANHPDPAQRILFLTEGDSAIGQLSNVRDPQRHGGFPLRGKIINAHGMTLNEIFENKEVKEIAAVLGIRPGEEVDPKDLEYGRIAIMADADHDGASIKALLVNLFMRLWPNLVAGGHLWAVEPPSYRWTDGTKVGFIYGQDEEALKAIPAKAKATYLKGLGSMNETDYAEMIRNPRWTKIEKDEDAEKSLMIAFGPSADARKVWLS